MRTYPGQQSMALVEATPYTEADIGTGDRAIYDTIYRMKQIVLSSSKNPIVREWARHILDGVQVNNKLNEATAIHNFVRDHVRYTKDPYGWEYIQTPPVLLAGIGDYLAGKAPRPIGDCVVGGTEVIVRDKRTAQYSLRTIESLQLEYPNFDALSYDFDREMWVFRAITDWSYRGEQDVSEVRFLNGTREYVTLGHKFYNAKLTNGKLRDVVVRQLGEIDYTSTDNNVQTSRNRVMCAKQIPCLGMSVDRTLDGLWLDGLYVAEGYGELHHGQFYRADIAQDKTRIREKMQGVIERLQIQGSWSNRRRHGYFRVAVQDAKHFEKFGRISIEKRIPEPYFSMSEKEIRALLAGYFDGDGTGDAKRRIYTTVSKRLAKHLAFLHLIVGQPLYYQEYVRPVSKYGKYDITRLYEFSSQSGYRREWMPGLSMVGPKSVTPRGRQRVYDITVDNTHNFVSSTGMIFHNCDDMTTLDLSLLRSVGFPVAIKVVGFGPSFSHVYGMVFVKDRWMATDTVRPDKYIGWEASNIVRSLEVPV